MPLGIEVGLGPGDFVLDGDPAPPQKKGQSPQFSAHVYCGETAGWIKMPLGMEVCFQCNDHAQPATPTSVTDNIRVLIVVGVGFLFLADRL